MSELAQLTLDAAAAPKPVLPCEMDHEPPDLIHDLRAPVAMPGAAVVLLCNELESPTQDRVGGHDGADLVEQLPAEGLAPNREAPSLVVDESEPAITELLHENAVFFAQVLNEVLLPLSDRAGDDHAEQLSGPEDERHPARLAGDCTAKRRADSL